MLMYVLSTLYFFKVCITLFYNLLEDILTMNLFKENTIIYFY